MAACFSGYMQLFARGQSFTYGLASIARYYCDYVSVMDHWDEVLPGKVLRVQYEDVVADTESQVRRMLENTVPGVVVLSYNEIARGISVESVGVAKVE